MSREPIESDATIAADEGRDYHGAVDALQADLAKHQRIVGTEVTASANQAFAVATVEMLAKEHAEQAGRTQAPVAPPPLPEPGIEERELNGHKWTLDKSAEPDRPFRNATEFEANVIKHAMPRIRTLLASMESGFLGSPSWHTRTVAAMYFKVRSLEAEKSGRKDLAEKYERQFMQDVYDLLEESNAKFGDWRNDEAKPLIVQV
jgi:hypothetical protein